MKNDPPLMFLREPLVLELRCAFVIDRRYGGQRLQEIVRILNVVLRGTRMFSAKRRWNRFAGRPQCCKRASSRPAHICESGAFRPIVVDALDQFRSRVVVILLRFNLLLQKGPVESQAETLGA